MVIEMMDRRCYENNVYTHSLDVDWFWLRRERNRELAATDWWALKDHTMSQEKKDYRVMLRNLPQDHESANDACDAWFEYTRPE
jgi:hypothetical protein